FDFFLDYNLVAAALAGVDTTFPPDPAHWTGVAIPQIVTTLATAWPSGLTPDGENLKAMTELRSGGERPLFDAAFLRWATFLLGFGSLDGTVPRSPGVVVDNTDTVYQFDTDPALSPAEQALNESVLRVAATPAPSTRSTPTRRSARPSGPSTGRCCGWRRTRPAASARAWPTCRWSTAPRRCRCCACTTSATCSCRSPWSRCTRSGWPPTACPTGWSSGRSGGSSTATSPPRSWSPPSSTWSPGWSTGSSR